MTVLLQQMAIAALVSGALTMALTPLVKRLAFKAGVVRHPRERDVHTKPIPLWGGLAMFAAFVITLLVTRLFFGPEEFVFRSGQHPILGILLGGTLVAIVGLLDDKYDLSAGKQTLGLLAGGFIAAYLGARIEGITHPFAPPSAGYDSRNYLELGIFSIPITMLWIFLVAKTFDFLDGLDGLAAGVCAISATTMALLAATTAKPDPAVAVLAAVLVGVCVGFLRHNYNPASIFMGTIGAQFLGFVLACLAVVGALKIPATITIAIPLLVLGVPVFDGLFVILRRLWLRQAPHKPDRAMHIHHRFLNRGLSAKQTVWAIYTLTASFCMLALLLAWKFAR